MYSEQLKHEARRLLHVLRSKAMMIATAESCTGGLIAGLLTEIPGSSDVVERGFVTYSNLAKSECLGVHPELINQVGAVSEQVARAMAEGALIHSEADIAVSVTGVAGPGGGTPTKPVGLVHIAVAATGEETRHREYRFGDIERDRIRLETVAAAISQLADALHQTSSPGSALN